VGLLKNSGFNIEKTENKSFRWFLFWALLVPFGVKHEMGIPKNRPALVDKVGRFVNKACSFRLLEAVGNIFLPKSRFYYSGRRKLRILVVYDYANWILGSWAQNIAEVLGDEFDIVHASMISLMENRDEAIDTLKKVDLVHALLPHPVEFIKEVSVGTPVIATIHHWVEWTPLYQLAAQSDYVITGSTEWKDKLVEKGVRSDVVSVIFSGVGKEYFQDCGPLVPKGEKLSMGFFAKKDSNENDRKGSRYLIETAETLLSMGLGPNYRLIVSGPGWDEEVERLRGMGLEVVHFPYVEKHEMPRLYRSVDVYLMLSDVEGGPVTIAESMVSGCLVFATRTGIVNDIVKDRVNGVVVSTDDIGKLVSDLEFVRHPLRNIYCKVGNRYPKVNGRSFRVRDEQAKLDSLGIVEIK